MNGYTDSQVMNLFFKSYRICLIFFLLLTWEPGFNCGLAQDSGLYQTPWIQEIKFPSQYSDIPNVSFFKDDLGHLFLGKANGLSIVDGNRTIHLHMEGPVYITETESDGTKPEDPVIISLQSNASPEPSLRM